MGPLDAELQRWVVEHRVGLLDPVFEALTYAGSFGLLWLVLALLVAGRPWRRPWLPARVAATVLLAEALQGSLKVLFQRDRPPVANPEPGPLVALPHTYSFPSGHALVAFASATVLAAAVPRLRLPLFAVAALVAWSRVYVGVHYPGDVLAGALLGVALGLGVEAARRPLREWARRDGGEQPG
ncbi:MAG TPA: phosphatase PAP2 family protein [Gaiellaceae bacterium]|nr:phosphatase PAP2 family protein [Gaiellaceae bacterium]